MKITQTRGAKIIALLLAFLLTQIFLGLTFAAPGATDKRIDVPLPQAADLAGIIKRLAKPGDLVVCLGAGNITQWAYALPNELKALG